MYVHLTKFLIGHLTFYASLESKNPLYKNHASIDKPRLYRDSASYSIQNKNDWYFLHRRRVSKGTLISKSHTFSTILKYPTETISIYIFVCFKMLLTAVV